MGVDAGELPNLQGQSGLHERAEAQGGDADFIRAGRQKIETELPVVIALDGPGQAGILISRGDLSALNDRALSVEHVAYDASGDLLCIACRGERDENGEER